MKLFTTSVFSFIVGIVLSFTVISVLATSATSDKGYFAVNSHNYYNQATVCCDSTSAWAYSGIFTSDFTNVPTGYMGAKGMLYDSQGNLLKEGSIEYNDSAASGIDIPTFYNSRGKTYCSKGKTYAYNGNGYTAYWTFQSPNVSN